MTRLYRVRIEVIEVDETGTATGNEANLTMPEGHGVVYYMQQAILHIYKEVCES